jgi:hypothetical protein
MSIDVHLGATRGGALTAWTASLHAPPRARDDELDPLAGEDELWAAEDVLWTPGEENYIRFLRSLFIVVLCSLLFWILVAAVGLRVLGLTPA